MKQIQIPDEGEWVLVDERTGDRKFIGGTHKGDTWEVEDCMRLERADEEDQIEVAPRPPKFEVEDSLGASQRQVGGDHYRDREIQPVEYAHANDFGYCESFVLKYITRHRDKGGAEDIRKAIHSLELLLEEEYGE